MAVTIAPWLVPADVLGAARAGTSAGLTARGQDIQQQEAQDRLALAYAQLSSENQRASEAAQAKMELAQKAMDLREQQSENLARYREQQLSNQQQRMQDLGDYRDQVMDWRNRTLDQRQALAEMSDKLRQSRIPNIHFGPNGEVLQANSDGTVRVLRERDTIEKPATLEMPLNPNDPFGAKLRGTPQQVRDWMTNPGNGSSLPAPRSATNNDFPNAPDVGTVEDGYRYKGGDPASPDSWEQVNSE